LLISYSSSRPVKFLYDQQTLHKIRELGLRGLGLTIFDITREPDTNSTRN